MDNTHISPKNLKQKALEFKQNSLVLKQKAANWLSGAKRRWRNRPPFYLYFIEQARMLTISQWFYIAATSVFIYEVSSETKEVAADFTWVALLAAMGLVRELMQVFSGIWNSSYGKGVVVVTYAAIANIALAIASQEINTVTGIEPSYFIFTLAFVTMLMIPVWIFVSTFLFLSFFGLLAQIWFLITLLLRIIRIKLPLHWEDRSFVISSMIMRIVLIPIVFVSMIQVFTPYVRQVEFLDERIIGLKEFLHSFKSEKGAPIISVQVDENGISNGLSEKEISELQAMLLDVNMSDVQRKNILALLDKTAINNNNTDTLVNNDNSTYADSSLEQATNTSIGEVANLEPSAQDEIDVNSQVSAEDKPKQRMVDMVIAAFVYHLETYPQSRCKIEEGQHALSLNDYEVLVVTPDENAQFNYRFEPLPCIPRSGATFN